MGRAVVSKTTEAGSSPVTLANQQKELFNMSNMPERMEIPTVEELIETIEEAAYQSLGYWDSSCTPAENAERFKEYDRLTALRT